MSDSTVEIKEGAVTREQWEAAGTLVRTKVTRGEDGTTLGGFLIADCYSGVSLDDATRHINAERIAAVPDMERAIRRVFEEADRHADGAEDASDRAKFCAWIADLLRPVLAKVAS